MKNRIIGMLLTVIILLCNFHIEIYAKETPDELLNLYAQSAVLMDADSGRILFGKNENKVLPMASTTKIMTCILALENMNDGMTATVSDYAASQPKVKLGVKSGEQYYVQDLLYSLMLESHNDSAVVIAETIAGSVEKFAELMNQKAAEIGCTNTYFITPNGLDAKDKNGIHSTTGEDLALMMRYCIQQSKRCEEFLKITRTSAYQFTDITGKRNFSCNNHNAFLTMMEGALSGKTGFTNDAGYCYVGALRRGNRTFIVALLACGWPNNKNYKWKDTRKLMEYALENYEYRNVRKIDKCKEIKVKNGINISNPLRREMYVKTKVMSQESAMNILMKEEEKIDIKIIYEQGLEAPLEEGRKVGAVYYLLDGDVIQSDAIITAHPTDKISKKFYAKYLMDLFCL